MESTSNHHHLQDHQPPAVEPSSLSTTTPAASSCYGSPLGGTNLSWTPNITNLNAGNYLDRNVQEANPRSRALTDNNDIRVPPRPLNGSMIQDDLGYHHHWWTSDIAQSWLTTSQSTHHHLDLQFSKTKEEISGTNSLRKFSSEMPNIPSSMEGYGLAATSTTTTTTTTTTTRMKNNEHRDMSALNEKLLLKTLFSGDFYSTNAQNYHNFCGAPSGVTSRGSFSQIYPSVNISNLNQPSSNYSTAISSSLDMSAQSLDLLTTAKSFSSGLSHPSQQDLGGPGRFAADNLSFRIDHMLHPIDCRSSCSNSSNPSHFTDGTAEAKRPCTSMEPKASQPQMASKKSRSESRPSCPPFKVRKEKLGDRIAALQQLVAPFGKTDTASVLMEAIGYIKFLQSQVETLSVPYMKPSQNQTNRVMQGGSAIGDASGEPKQDLRSRGLCLVPLSCMSYIAGDGGSEVWQQPNFGGAT